MPCIIFPNLFSPLEIRKTRILDNEHRTDFPPVERAREYQGMMEESERAGKKLTVQDLADELKISVQTINNYLLLLKLPKDIQTAVNLGQIPQSFALKLLTIKQGSPAEIEQRQMALASAFIAGKIKTFSPAGESSRPKLSGSHGKKAPIFQRSIRVSNDISIIIGSKSHLTEKQCAQALSDALGSLSVPIHGKRLD